MAAAIPVVRDAGEFQPRLYSARARRFPAPRFVHGRHPGRQSVTATANLTAGSYAAMAQSGSIAVPFALTNVADVAAARRPQEHRNRRQPGMPFRRRLQVTVTDGRRRPGGRRCDFVFGPCRQAQALCSRRRPQLRMRQELAYALATANMIEGSHTVTAMLGPLHATFSLDEPAADGVISLHELQPIAIRRGSHPEREVTPSSATGKITFYDGITILGSAPLPPGPRPFRPFCCRRESAS